MNGKMERVKKRIDEIKKEREELKEKYDYLVEQMKKTIDKHSQDIEFLKNEVKRTADREEKDEGGISNIRSVINSLEKKIATVGGKQAVMREKLKEEVDLMGGKLDSEISEKIKIIQNKLVDDLKIEIDKSLEGLQIVEKDVRKMENKHDKLEEKISNLNLLGKSISKLEGGHDALKIELNERVNLLEREISSELAKAKMLGERLSKDIENFEKFASEEKSEIDKFESKVLNKIDIFAMEKENLKRGFTSISNDFKNLGTRLDALNEKDSDLNQRLQNLELDAENFKKVTEEILGKLKEDHAIFKENFVAKLNETNEKILNRVSQNELGTSSDLAKQAEEIKLFRAHVTQFINDLVSNYEKRFEMMKSEIDQALRILEERSKEQRAMIFE